jgi:hypothetical protein
MNVSILMIGEQMDRHQEELAFKRKRIRESAKRMIFVTLMKEGIHKYPEALTDPSLKTNDEYDVSFLGHPHRHMFHFKIGIEVFHDNREIEFIQFKRWIENLYRQNTLQLDFKSCEMIADDLFEQIALRYPNRDVEITVSEDNENGATIYYNTHRPIQSISI